MTETHPCLFFSDISDTPGWKYQSESPYSSWHSGIPSYAENLLTYDFSSTSNREVYKSERAFYLAVAYHISGDTRFAAKAVEALEYIGNSGDVSPEHLIKYAATYDLVYNYILSEYPEKDASIRDSLAYWADQLYQSYYDDFARDPGALVRSCALGIVAVTLKDYVSPYDSGVSDWLEAATTWLFENYEPRGRPAINVDYNPGGVERGTESYEGWWLPWLIAWLVAYKRNYEDPLSRWPVAKEVLLYQIRTTLPDKRRPNYGTQGNVAPFWIALATSILPSDESGWVLWYVGDISASMYEFDKPWFYILYDKFAATASEPSFTSFVSDDAESVIFRSGWGLEDNYLWLRVLHYPFPTNRVMTHHDTLSFEYCAKGDLLLSDSGEIKHYISDPERLGSGGYGASDSKGHNVIMINDGTGKTGGVTKGFGSYTDFESPAHIKDLLVSDFFDFAEAEMSITEIEDRSPEPSPSNGWYWGHDYYEKITLSSPVTWRRSVLYPKDYFVVLDDVLGDKERQIDTLFHLASFNITETTYNGDDATPGYVHGDLFIEGNAVDWLSQNFGEEVSYGLANLIKWKTTSKYTGKPIELYIFTSPKSEVTVEKFWTRIDGYAGRNEVDHPLIRFKLYNTPEMHRITVLYAIHPNEEQAPTFDGTSNENFTLVHVKTQSYDDFIASGNNIVTQNFSTDASYSFLRTKSGNLLSFFIRNGTFLKYNGVMQIKTSKLVDHLALKQEGERRIFYINDGSVSITVYNLNPNLEYQVKRDGMIYTDWTMLNASTMLISTDSGEHVFEIEPTTPDSSPPAISNITVTNTTANSCLLYTSPSPRDRG